MPPNNAATYDQVILLCPACGAREAADAAMLADAPTIVCRNCGETWPTAEAGVHPTPPRPNASLHHVVEAQRKPLVTYSGAVDPAWAAKMDGDILPAAERRRSRFPRAVASLASLLFIALFFLGREAAVAALPDLARLYDTLGMPVNLDGLEIRGVSAERAGAGTPGRVLVRGEIVNTSTAALPVPPLQVGFTDGASSAAGSRAFEPPGRTLSPRESAPFTLELDEVPEGASGIALRFRRPGEPGPAAPAQSGAAP